MSDETTYPCCEHCGAHVPGAASAHATPCPECLDEERRFEDEAAKRYRQMNGMPS